MPGHARQREREALRRVESYETSGEEQHAGEHETEPHDQAEHPVVEDHVERDEAEADETGDDAGRAAGPCRASATRSDRLLVLVELHRQRAVPQHEREVLRLALREVTGDLDVSAR